MINVGRYGFDGPLYAKESLKEAPGVYAVLDDRGPKGHFVLDVGESEAVRTRIENHDRERCWVANAQGRRCYAVLYMPGSNQVQRQRIEGDLREQYEPVCGVR